MEMDSRPYRAFVALFASALLVLAGLLASGILPFGAPTHPVGTMPVSSEATGNFDQLVVVLMENKNLNEVYGPAPYFFFQAEDGIRYLIVTGVQTCALPI